MVPERIRQTPQDKPRLTHNLALTDLQPVTCNLQPIMNFTQIKETCLYFHDLEKAKDFYSGKLELAIIGDVRGKHVFFRVGSSVLLCFNPDDSRQKKNPPGHSGSGKIH